MTIRATPFVALALALLLLPALPGADAYEQSTEIWDYPGMEKAVMDYEDGSLQSEWGYWGPPVNGENSSIFSEILDDENQWGGAKQGQKFHLISFRQDATYDWQAGGKITFHTTAVNMLQLKTLTLQTAVSFGDTEISHVNGEAWVYYTGRSFDASGSVLEQQRHEFRTERGDKDHIYTGWQEMVFDDLYHPQAVRYSIEIAMGFDVTDPGEYYLNIQVDDIRGYSPPSDVRFSYFNEYTGLGLQSELLIPEINYDGEWHRVYDGHMVFGAGEYISYRIRDYFGQVINQSAAFILADSTVYVDIPVKMVKVQIAKPDWWTSDLPPEWQLMYEPTGKQITVSGWELEMLAGWYNFAWHTQKVTNSANNITDTDDESVVAAGNVTTYIDGNITAARSHSLQNFFLTMEPTYSGTVNQGGFVLPSLDSWEGIYQALNVLFTQIMQSTEYKAVMVMGGLFSVVGIVGMINRKRKKGGNRK